MIMNKIFYIFLLVSSPVFALGLYDAKVVKVIDGDTIKLDVAIWVDITKHINLRLDGVNTPEKRGAPLCEKALSLKATLFTQQWLDRSTFIKAGEIKKGKYAGRVLGNIYNDKNESLTNALIKSGHGVEYHGGKRVAWCID